MKEPSKEAMDAARAIAAGLRPMIDGKQLIEVALRIDAAADAKYKRLVEAVKPFAAFSLHMEKVPRLGMADELYGLDGKVFIRKTELDELRSALAELEKSI